MTKSDKVLFDIMCAEFEEGKGFSSQQIFKLIDIVRMQEMELELLRSQSERSNSIANYYESKYNELLQKEKIAQ